MITDKQRKLIKDIEETALTTMTVFEKLNEIEPMVNALVDEFARLNARVEHLTGLVKGVENGWLDDPHCPWCGWYLPPHSDDCPAFTPGGDVK